MLVEINLPENRLQKRASLEFSDYDLSGFESNSKQFPQYFLNSNFLDSNGRLVLQHNKSKQFTNSRV